MLRQVVGHLTVTWRLFVAVRSRPSAYDLTEPAILKPPEMALEADADEDKKMTR
jgi:hypothetical protein